MRIFWALLRRELSSFFLSLTGYVIIAAVTLDRLRRRGGT